MGRVRCAWLAAAVLAGCSETVELDRLPAGPSATAVEARSGDTLRLENGQDLKLAGVEAPGPGRPYAEEARRALHGLAAGRALDLAFDGARADDAGRQVAQARIAGTGRWLEGELLRAGAVRVRTQADNRALARPMLDAEAAARRAGRGLWGRPEYRVRLPGEVPSTARGFEVVEGRIVRAGRTGGFAYLDFSTDWRGGLSVHLPAAALDDFQLAGRHPFDLQGRLVRVRGLVEGRVLWIDHPEALELLREP
jgi:endonuclease YncB( thermonuclease family)